MLLRPAWDIGASGLGAASKEGTGRSLCFYRDFRTQTGPGKANLESWHTTGNLRSAGQEIRTRHTATPGPGEERRELRDASCSELANIGLADLGALIVLKPPLLRF